MKSRYRQNMTDARCRIDLTKLVAQSTFLAQRYGRYHRKGISVQSPLTILAYDGTAEPYRADAESLSAIGRKGMPVLGLDTQGSGYTMTEQI